MTRNAKAYAIIENDIVTPLHERIKHDSTFSRRCRDALASNGYLKGR